MPDNNHGAEGIIAKPVLTSQGKQAAAAARPPELSSFSKDVIFPGATLMTLMAPFITWRFFLALLLPAGLWLVLAPLASAADIVNDPKGFRGITWGSSLTDVPGLKLVESLERVKGYELKDGPPPFGEAKVDSVRLFMVDGQFGRVMVHYQGKQTHDAILAYLQQQFGPIDRSPGSMMRGLNQQFNWRGSETEVNLTYEARRERGFLAIESRNLTPRFNDALADTGSSY